MATAKRVKLSSKKKTKKPWSEVLTSSQEVWHAGLGALAEAQDKGRIHLDKLVSRGREIDQRLANEARKKQAAQRKALFKKGAPPLDPALTREKVSLLFEQRVSRALDRLGMRPTADTTKLSMRVENLSARLEVLSKRLATIEGAKKEVKRKPTKQR